MKRNISRRALLTAAASGTVALAGCGVLGDSSNSNNDGNTPTSDGTATPPGQETTPTETGTPAETQNNNQIPQRAYTKRGEVIDDFEDLELWGTIQGEATPVTDSAFSGSQSVRLQNPSGGAAGIFKSFPDGLDLSNHDLSIAAKLNKPADAKIALEVLAPARSDHLVCRRYIPEAMNGWMRIDLGYTGLRGNPMLESVQELRLVVLSDGEPVDYVVDDLRKIPKATNQGRVILSFQDTHDSQYDVAYEELEKRGWPAMVSAIPDEINSDDALSTGELRTMRDSNWDVISSPFPDNALPEYSEEEQRRILADSKEYLKLKGFREGMEFVSIPYGRFDATTLNVVSDLHEYGFAFGACPSNTSPVGKAAVSTVSGSDLNGAARMINLAAQYNQLTVVTFSEIGPDAAVDKEHFTHLLDIIQEWEQQGELKVTTPSEVAKL